MADKKQRFSPLSALGVVIGAVFGKVVGIHLLIPTAGAFAAWWVGSKVSPDRFKPFLPTFSLNAGHCAWISMALVLAPSRDYLIRVGPDLLFYAIGFTWLLASPGKGALRYFAVFQALCLAVNLFAIVGTSSVDTTKALAVHVVWRIAVIVVVMRALVSLKHGVPAAAVIEGTPPA